MCASYEYKYMLEVDCKHNKPSELSYLQ